MDRGLSEEDDSVQPRELYSHHIRQNLTAVSRPPRCTMHDAHALAVSDI